MGGVAFATTVAISTRLRDGPQVTRRRHVGPPPRRGLRRASWGRTDYSNPRSATSPRPASRDFVPAASFRTTMVAEVWVASVCAYAGGYASTVISVYVHGDVTRCRFYFAPRAVEGDSS